MVRRVSATIVALIATNMMVSAQKNGPTLDEVLARVGAYVASYGEKAAVVVATEKYSQIVSVSASGAEGLGQGSMARPRELEAEFAIVRAGDGWTGFRDVVKFDGRPVQDRRDRLVSLLTDTSGDVSELTRIAAENARFNIGPVSRNFNVPTAALFFFTPKDLGRFTFARKGTPKVDGTTTWEISFTETQRPTLIRTRSGADVPIEGALWVKPDDGVVVKTLLRMRNFAEQAVSRIEGGPQEVKRRPNNPASNNGGREGLSGDPPILDSGKASLQSEASMEVTYRKPAELGVWFPAEMQEFYSGPIIANNRAVMAGARTRAKYSNFRQFGTSIKIVQ